jgi:hypothetical protein
MRRRLVTILSAISLVMCAMTAFLWVRSFFVFFSFHDDFVTMDAEHHANTRGWAVGLTSGRLSVVRKWDRDLGGVPHDVGWGHNSDFDRLIFFRPGSVRWWLPGIFYYDFQGHWAKSGVLASVERGVQIQLWLLMALFAAAPYVWTRAWIKQRTHRLGFCGKCGYDLRATPDRCPECGAAVTTTGAMSSR